MNDTPRFRTLLWSGLALLIVALSFYRLWRGGEIWYTWLLWLLLGALVLFPLWLFFFAQFVLPLHGLRNRWRIFRYLLYYLLRRHGPALFVQDGQILPRQGERLSSGPGIVVLDTASAAVLRSNMRYTRAVGPGVVFTVAGETLRQEDVLDLRLISGQAGPRLDEDPFAPQGENETSEAYAERQRRRHETEGLTRDGIPVVASLVVVFHLDNRPDDLSPAQQQHGRFRTEFYGHREAAWRAIVHRPVDASTEAPAVQRLPWSWLPPYLAAELWKTYIRRFTFEQLFSNAQGPTAVQRIQHVLRERLTAPQYEELDAFGLPTGTLHTSPEYRLLQERGVRVTAVVITRLAFPPEYEERLAQHWSNSWLQSAIIHRELIEQQHELQRHRAEGAALSQIVQRWLRSPNPDEMREALGLQERFDNADLLRQVVCRLTRNTLGLFDDPKVHATLGSAEEERLRDIVHWLEHHNQHSEAA